MPESTELGLPSVQRIAFYGLRSLQCVAGTLLALEHGWQGSRRGQGKCCSMGGCWVTRGREGTSNWREDLRQSTSTWTLFFLQSPIVWAPGCLNINALESLKILYIMLRLRGEYYSRTSKCAVKVWSCWDVWVRAWISKNLRAEILFNKALVNAIH